jgi:hypothetical protein
MKRITGASIPEMEKIVRAASESYHGDCSWMLSQFESAQTTDEKAAIAMIIGIYKDSRAAPALAKNIDLEASKAFQHHYGEPTVERWPVAFALELIGSPATPHILKAIAATDSPRRICLCAGVIRGIYVREVGEVVLRQAIADTGDDVAKKRLEEAISWLRKPTNTVPEK